MFDASGNRLSGSTYFDKTTLDKAKTNYDHYTDKGEWSSILDSNNANSTHGTVMVKAINSDCYIYAIANVSCSEAAGALKTALDNVTNINGLYQLDASLSEQADLLDRGNAKLLMSGVFIKKEDKNKYAENYTQGTAGIIAIATIPEDANGRKDLRTAGVIKLRRLSSHISFVLKVDYSVFSDFTPDSWQVVHIPKRSRLMDVGDDAMADDGRIVDDEYFTNSELQTSMLRTEGNYHFDFYMFENHKQAKEVDNSSWYYKKYGPTIDATTYKDIYEADQPCENLGLYSNIPSYYDAGTPVTAAEMFTYAKRELEQKYDSGDNKGQIQLNKPNNKDQDIQNSKKFVYSEDNATYVVIKGRLRFNSGVNLKKITLAPTDNTNNEGVAAESYADVTFLVHLGYARENNLQGNSSLSADSYKLSDFNSLRNTEYTYEVTINGVNSIYTHVKAKGDDEMDSSKLLPGASGFIGLAAKDVFNLDAHYNAFVIQLGSKDIDKFYYEINTPWNTIKATDISSETLYNSKYKNESDFNWIHFRFNGVSPSTPSIDYTMDYEGAKTNNLELVKPYKLSPSVYSASNTDGNYKDDTYGLMDLYQLKAFINDQYETWGTGVYNAYFSVYVDEYYYNKSPMGQSWENTDGEGHILETPTMWHNFVNQPDRYITFSSSQADRSYDGESSVMKTELMVVQKSIQTFYSTEATSALGIERKNETPNPRWFVEDAAYQVNTNGLDRKNGYRNSQVISTAYWKDYVQQAVDPDFNNLKMVATNNTPDNTLKAEDEKNGVGNTDNPYAASAIRLCMNRNRDENGDGLIKDSELKWYLPASEQIGYVALFHFALYDPLFPYNEFYKDSQNKKSDGYGNDYWVMPEINSQSGGYDEANGYLMGNYVYVTSDFKKIQTQEMMNIKDYNYSSSVARTGQMRCVRNLGATVNATPDDIFDKSTVTSSRTFVLDNLDSRSLRSSKVDGKELEPHTLYSELDRPYRKFQVAKDYVTVEKNASPWNGIINLREALSPGPCRKYRDTDEPKTAEGSWRVPNQTELALMILYDGSLSSGETSKKLLPSVSGGQFITNTAWDFTPHETVWGRVIATRQMGSSWATTLTAPNYKNNKWLDSQITANNLLVRCVKDVD
jgi:hypothetical protein